MTREGCRAKNSLDESHADTYDADGRRVRRGLGEDGEVWQVYGAGGELLAEYAPASSPSQPLKEYGYRSGELLVTADAPTRRNVALASAGATATALRYTPDGAYPGLTFQPTYANDGARYVSPQGDRYWRDGVGLPTWVEVDFTGPKTIDEVDVYTLADHPVYQTQSNPTATQTFTQYGVTSFEVQYWTGSVWATVPGGSITGNNKVWRRFTFPAVTTSKVRVLINNALAGRSRLVEVEAWGSIAGSTTADVRWLVSDHLGTPRMALDKTGSLAGVTRHDYLPFGEDLQAGAGGRTTIQGYDGAYNVRQKFTGYERDEETNLDYAQARYYTGRQGRFTSVDALQSSANPGQPQSWNRYTYTLNNPLNFTDPTGLISCPPGVTCVNQNTSDEHYFDPDEDDYVHSGSGGTPGSSFPVAGYARTVAAGAGQAAAAGQTATTLTGAAALPWVAAGGAAFNLYLLGQRLTMDTIPYSPYGMTMSDGTRSISCTAGNQALQPLQGPRLFSESTQPVATQVGTPWTEQPERLRGDMVVVRGGTTDLPPRGAPFSGAVGYSLIDAAASVPHGTIRSTTVQAIINTGGSVILIPEPTRSGVINFRHVNIIEGSVSTFSRPFDNPVPRKLRIP